MYNIKTKFYWVKTILFPITQILNPCSLVIITHDMIQKNNPESSFRELSPDRSQNITNKFVFEYHET